MAGPAADLLGAAAPGAPGAADALAVYADWLLERDDGRDARSAVLLRALFDDPLTQPLGAEVFEATNDVEGRVTSAVVICRFRPFADALGLPDDVRAPDCELVLLPPLFTEGPPLLVARTPVTRRLWAAIAGEPSPPADDRLLPATGVSYDMAVHWCAHGLRPPDEDEWVRAARAGTSTPYCFGDTLDLDLAWYAADRPAPVATHPPNAYGLHDVHGNAAELCWVSVHDGGRMVVAARGGSYADDADGCRIDERVYYPKDQADATVGLRVVRDVGSRR